MHRVSLSFVFGAAALVAVACDSNPAALSGPDDGPMLQRDGRPAHQNTRSPFARTVANPCPPVPEPVAVEGYTHYNAHFKFFDGGNQARLMSNTHASGVGAVTGVLYQFHELWTLRGKYTYVNNRWETEQTTRFHVISQTDLGNFFSTLKTKIIYTPTSIETEVVSFETDCRG